MGQHRLNALVGLGCLAVSSLWFLYARESMGFAVFLPGVGVYLFGHAIRKGVEPWMVNAAFGTLAFILCSYLVGHPGQLSTLRGQLIITTAVAAAVGAASLAVPRKARRLAYGLLIAAAWAMVLPIWFGAASGRASFIVALIVLAVLSGFTILFRTWTLTGLPPAGLTDLFDIKSRTVQELWGDPTPLKRAEPVPAPVPTAVSMGDTAPEVRTIST